MSEERKKERCKREDIATKVVRGFLKKDCDEDTELYYSLETLLNLIEKQQKEIDELQAKLEIEKIDNKYNQEERDEETIPRYKIKEKIKYWKNERHIAGEHLVVKVLEELLGE